jgi:hypothetical protein
LIKPRGNARRFLSGARTTDFFIRITVKSRATSKSRAKRVASAAPSTPIAGKPNFPNIKTKLSPVLMERAKIDTISGIFALWVVRKNEP